MEVSNRDDMLAQFAAFLERKDAGVPQWDAELANPIERFYFDKFERETKGTSPGGFGAHADRWHEETGLLILAGLLPDTALDEPDYEVFRAIAWDAMRSEILKRNVGSKLSALERLDLAQQVCRVPTNDDECRAALLLIL